MTKREPSVAVGKAEVEAVVAPAWERSLLALAWLLIFSVWFYSFGLPNNHPATRSMIWPVLPFGLLDLIDPPPAEPGTIPWSWLYLGQRVPFLAVAVVIWYAALCLGRLELRVLRTRSLFDNAERFYFAGCLGLATVSLLMLGLGLAGWMSRWPMLIVLSSATLAEAWLTQRERSTIRQEIEAAPNSKRRLSQAAADSWPWLRIVVIGVVTLFVGGMLLGAMSPQRDFDVIEYHLGGPKEWFLQGQIARLPHNVYTSFPFLTEMLLLSGMVLWGDWQWGALAGQAVIAGFAPLAALGIYATGRRWFSESAGLLGALIWLTTPWAYRISIIAYAEGGLACYLFAAFALALRLAWKPVSNDEPTATIKETRQLNLICGLLAGSAMACKYTGLISVVVPVFIVIAWTAFRSDNKDVRLKYLISLCVAFSVGTAIAIGPWLLKNAVETGNPVFPLAYSIFGGEGRDEAMAQQWGRGHSRHYANLQDRLLDLPVKLTDIVANNDWHSALMFGLAPIALLASWRKKVWFVWVFIGWQFLSWFLFTHQIDRFYVPMFPVVALLAGCGASWLVATPLGRLVGGTVMLVSILFNVWIMQNIGGYNAGRTDLKAAVDVAASPPLQWINSEFAAGHLPGDFKVLCVGEAALFHARFPYVYNTVFDRSLFEQWCAERSEAGELHLRPADQIRKTLSQQGITHVLVNWAEILRYREPGSYGFTDFAHPDWLAKLQAAGVLDPPLPLPDRVAFMPAADSKLKQAVGWAPSLYASRVDGPEIRFVQIFPVKR